MDRRDFIQMVAAMAATQWLSTCRKQTVGIPEGTVVIDVHSHVFNAADLPVDGFIEYVATSNVKIPGVSTLAGILVQAIADVGAPRFDSERERLDVLIGSKSQLQKASEKWKKDDIDRETSYSNAVNERINRIRAKERTKAASASEQEFLQELYREMNVDAKSTREVDWYSRAKKGIGDISRYLAWGFKLLRYRYQQVEDFRQTYPRVDMFMPALVDFDHWFVRRGVGSKEEELRDEKAKATRVPIDKQMELMQLIARWSHGAMHPYVAYDPRRDVENDGQALDWVKRATKHQGAIGVKLYPPMGFVALGNSDLSFCNSSDGKLGGKLDGALLNLHRYCKVDEKLGSKLDRALLNLYRYCEQEEIPLLVHAANTNYNGRCEAYHGRADPKHWERVLERFPALRLNLGHFGTHELPGGDWSTAMRKLMLKHEHVYADLSHVEEIRDPQYVREFFNALDGFFGDDSEVRKKLQQRILYGSDWIMVAKEEVGRDYFNKMVREYGARLGDQARDQFVAENAARFLGLTGGKNRYALKQAAVS